MSNLPMSNEEIREERNKTIGRRLDNLDHRVESLEKRLHHLEDQHAVYGHLEDHGQETSTPIVPEELIQRTMKEYKEQECEKLKQRIAELEKALGDIFKNGVFGWASTEARRVLEGK
jgi:uncharacterized protein YhaN